MAYRDDLEAARIRLAELESELDDARSQITSLRSNRSHPGRRSSWGWLALGGGGTLVLLGAGAGQALYAQDRIAERDAAELRHQLAEAEAEAAQARADRQVALDMMMHDIDRKQEEANQVREAPEALEVTQALAGEYPETSDPLRAVPTTFLSVRSDVPARIAVDGSSVFEWSPTMIPIQPGQHSVSVIAADGRVRRHRVTVRRGQTLPLTVHFDR
jgi:hypothetical protein